MIWDQPVILDILVLSPVVLYAVVSLSKELHSYSLLNCSSPAVLFGIVKQHQWLCFLEQETSHSHCSSLPAVMGTCSADTSWGRKGWTYVKPTSLVDAAQLSRIKLIILTYDNYRYYGLISQHVHVLMINLN